MPLIFSKTIAKTEAYKELQQRLESGENREDALRKVMEICDNCRPPSPIMCVEFCEVWKLKRKYWDSFEALAKKPKLAQLLTLLKNKRRLKILEILRQKCSLRELRNKLKREGFMISLSLLSHRDVEPLKDASLIVEENGIYKTTSNGKRIYNIVSRSEIVMLPINPKGYEVEILKALLSGPRSYRELLEIVPRSSLHRVVKRLRDMNLIYKRDLGGRVFYVATKKRPTRKLSPTEMKIFKAIQGEGASAKSLSESFGISITRVYTYLRRLKYKMHVKREEKTSVFMLTKTGERLAKSLSMASNLVQN